MAMKLTRGRRDDRVEKIIKDPQGYFARARREAEAEVRQEMAREGKRRGERPAPA
jgi:hypothetical protein